MDECASARPELGSAQADAPHHAYSERDGEHGRPRPLDRSATSGSRGRATVGRRRARSGVSLPIAVVLIALAALQGALMAGTLSLLFRERRGVSRASSPPTSVSASNGRRSPTEVAGSAATSSLITAITRAAPAKAPSSPQPTTPVALADRALPIDAGVSAPTCDELLRRAGSTGESGPLAAAYGQLREAQRALVMGDMDGAQRALCKAALGDPKNPAIPLELAQLMLLRGDGASAVDWARKGLAQAPGDVRGQSVLGDGLARLGDYEGARRAWLKSLKIDDPSKAKLDLLSRLSVQEAKSSLKQRDLARAERYFRRAVTLNADAAVASIGLAEAQLMLGDASTALHWATYAVAVAPRTSAARVVLGDALRRQGELSQAENEWRTALQLDPSNFAARLRMSRLKKTR